MESKRPSPTTITANLKAVAALKKKDFLSPANISDWLQRTSRLRTLAHKLPRQDGQVES
jgi:hypothetical protein